ncbi:MAG TPA: DNA cytosine methyltransferase [Gemmataceae bacterium]|nr:DNA cytosine methyltransferase [Gemmataceae bacterium]
MKNTREMIIDSFAGGGGASLGIERALGRGPDVAINHDADAIAMHAANHPDTKHYPNDIWSLSPATVTKGNPVGLLWVARAQGFPDSYVLTGSKSSQVARIGNSVCPVMSEVLAGANYKPLTLKRKAKVS